MNITSDSTGLTFITTELVDFANVMIERLVCMKEMNLVNQRLLFD